MKCYAAYARNVDVRKLGSSGGIFPVISMKFIEDGGVVYASVYDKELNVLFKRIDNMEDLSESFTSKYMQSNSIGVYNCVCNDLKSGNKVLFCGTPCHVKALHKYLLALNVSKENLLSIDIICHGVPSQKVFNKFLDEYSDKKIVSLNMRNKDLGWNWGNYSWKMTFADGEEQNVKQSEIPYMKGFLSNIFLRPSCYNCKSKSEKYSDLTLGDYWGITDTNIDIDFRFGVSCLIANTDKGQSEFEKIIELLECHSTEYDDILSGNPSLLNSVRRPISRNKFFRKIDSCNSIECLSKKLNKRSLFKRIINKLYSKYIHNKTSIKDIKLSGKCIYSFKEDCSGCMACHSICQKSAITQYIDNEGFTYPVIDIQKCISCGLCEKVCPQK